MRTHCFAMTAALFSMLAATAACLINTSGLAAGEAKDARTGQPYVVLTGADGHVTQRGYHRVMSEEDLVKIWQQHKGVKESKDYDLYYNPLGLPTIDFGQCMVVAIFQGGDVNNAGLKAIELLEEKDRVVLRFENKSYQTLEFAPDDNEMDMAVPAVDPKNVKNVYGFFVLPRSNKTVVLEKNVQNKKGGPPVWKQVGPRL